MTASGFRFPALKFRRPVLGALAFMAAIAGGACVSMGARTIADVQANPGRYADRTITVEGVVTTSWGLPMVPFKVYRLSDGSGEILVVTERDRIPARHARVRVRGEVEPFALIAGRSFGLHLREKGIRYL